MIYISSHNIISSLGFSSEENLSKIRKGISGIQLSENKKLSPESVFVSLVSCDETEKRFSKISENSKKYTKYEKLLILSINNALKNSKVDIQSDETVFIFSTTKGNIDLLEKDNKNLFDTERLKLWKSSEIVADFFGKKNNIRTISNACISGTMAVITAQRLIEAGKYKNAVVAGADILSEFTLSGFQAFKAVSEGACKPFDIKRTGMTPGEGAATIILTSEKSLSDNSGIIIAGGANSNDANHISGPSRTGEELAFSIKKAISESNLSSDDIDFISGHGTATPYNDETESKALELAGLQSVPISGTKGYIGHTFGATGIIETVIAAEAIKNSEVYKTAGFEEIGVSGKINVQKEYKKINLNTALKTASGFGGCNAALVLKKENFSQNTVSFDKKHFEIIKKIKISNNQLTINDTIDYKYTDSDKNQFSAFAKAVYKNYKIKYPKFYKMDNLSKLGFLGAEILLNNTNILSNYKSEEISVILSNESSSLDTDAKYQKTIDDRKNYFPGPSVFVYTLANIMIGEICIKNKIKGENTVFISEYFDKDFIFDYADILFNKRKSKLCITGRVDYNYPKGNYIAELYLLESSK
ncbi:MAG: beta-ACP synthase [Bacteroidales bacterium]|nr:beta-ACP synthase [Bacteroidales bacterium]